MPTFDTPLHTNDQSIHRVLAAGLPVLLVVVEEQLAPALDTALRDIAKTEAGELLVATLDAALTRGWIAAYLSTSVARGGRSGRPFDPGVTPLVPRRNALETALVSWVRWRWCWLGG